MNEISIPIRENSVKFINASAQKGRGLNTTILSFLLATKINTEPQKDKKSIAIVSSSGYFGKENRDMKPFKDEIRRVGDIGLIDKYSIQADDLINMENGYASPTPHWEKLLRVIRKIDIMIIDRIEFFVSKGYLNKSQYEAKIKATLRLFEKAARDNNKNIIIIENNFYLSKQIEDSVENDLKILTASLEDHDISLKTKRGNAGYLKTDTINKMLQDGKKIAEIMKEKNVVTMRDLDRSEMRKLPRYKTGYNLLDTQLGQGLELGQVVSVLSDDEDFNTIFLTQMLLQTPNYFNPMYTNLTMNPRRLKEILESKSEGQKEKVKDISILTLSQLEKNGDINEITEKIVEQYHENDTRVIVIDNDLFLSDESVQNKDNEMDEVYKKLQIIANKYDILIFIAGPTTTSQITSLESKKAMHPVPIEDSRKAIKYVKTQVVFSSRGGLYITKSLVSAEHLMLPSRANPMNKLTQLNEKIHQKIEENKQHEIDKD